jgi:hypothetical protein
MNALEKNSLNGNQLLKNLSSLPFPIPVEGLVSEARETKQES